MTADDITEYGFEHVIEQGANVLTPDDLFTVPTTKRVQGRGVRR